jgi:uncharacterized alkaline shock family protein YloU
VNRLIELPLQKGELHIVDDVIAMIAESAVLSTKGVAGTISGFRDGIVRVVNKNPARGVNVISEENQVTIGVKISVDYGTNVSETCYIIQEKVKEEVEALADVYVKAVNIAVEHVALGQNEKEG